MLTRKVYASELYGKWLIDQQIGFSAILYLQGGLLNMDGFEKQLELLKPSYFGDSTLSLLSLLAPGERDESVKQAASVATSMLHELQSNRGINHQSLYNRAAIVFRDSNLDFISFLQWATRLSADENTSQVKNIWRNQDYLWGTGVWDSIRSRVENNDLEDTKELLDSLNAGFRAFRHESADTLIRLEALCDVYDSLHDLFEERGGIPAILHRLMLTLMNTQFCWPVQTVPMKGKKIGLTLPFAVSIKEDGKSVDGSQCFRPIGRAMGLHIWPANHEEGALGANVHHRFERSALQWDFRWHTSIRKGFEVGKKLWRSQNGRLNAEDKERRAGSSIEIDFSLAHEIISPHFNYLAGQPLTLEDRSAEAYWVQVTLGLLLPANRIPSGLVTGTVNQTKTGEYVLGDVSDLVEKLLHVSQIGFLQKMVLPDTPATSQAIRDLYKGDKSEESIEIRSDLLEHNLCSTVRDTADALQTAGWRRATFLGAAETRWAFSQLTRNLFELDDKNVTLCPTENDPLRRIWLSVERAKEAILGIELANEMSAVLLRSAEKISEKQLGYWLAKADHDIRSGDGLNGFRGAGLGVLCIRTQTNESDMRFWAHVFDALEASAEIWERFQFGNLKDSALALADLLNNFDANPSISKIPAPDYLVILDKAGATQSWDPRVKYLGDDRGSLKLLLNTFALRNRQQEHVLADNLQQREGREGRLGVTRILVVTEHAPPRLTYSKPPNRITATVDWSDALRVFRNGFSLHNARAVINELQRELNVEPISWIAFTQGMQELIGNRTLFSSRGEYYFTTSRDINTKAQFNAYFHEVAGLSFMPLISSAASSIANRRLEIGVHQAREAAWHFQQMYTYAGDAEQSLRSRKYQSAVAFLSSAGDWDTVRQLGFDKIRFGKAGFSLARSLLVKEQSGGQAPHTSRYALALNAGTNSLKNKMDSAEQHELHSLIRDISAEGRNASAYIPNKLALLSEEAFYLSKQYDQMNLPLQRQERTLTVPDALKPEILSSLKNISDYLYSEIIDLILKPIPQNGFYVFQLQHGWLEKNWQSKNPNDLENNLKFAYNGCLTDVSPTVSSWLKLLSLLSMPKVAIDYPYATRLVCQVLRLWTMRVADDVAFGFKVHYALQRTKDFSLRGQLLDARKNIHDWNLTAGHRPDEFVVLQRILETLCVGDTYPKS